MKKSTKKTTIKKKVVVLPVPAPVVPEANDEIIAALTSLKSSMGWAIILKILNDNISYLEKAILDKIDPLSKTTLSDSDIEILRMKRQLNIDLRDTPENYIKVVKDVGEVPEEYDPYFRTNEEIIKNRGQSSPPDDRG
jgi:hypothetical protein